MHTREIIAILYNINRGKNSPSKSGKQLFPLSIDKAEEVKLPLPEECQDIIKKLSKYMKN